MSESLPLDPPDTKFVALVARCRGEYLEMPGLCLTPAQAGRLWHVDVVMCKSVFKTLRDVGFLTETRNGAFARAS